MRRLGWKSLRNAVVLGAAFAAAPATAQEAKVGIITMFEASHLEELKNAVISGLGDAGYKNGENAIIRHESAQGQFATAQQISRKFIGDGMNVIVTVNTPTTQAALSTTKDIPIVFAAVTDPVGAKFIASYDEPRGNLTGVSDFAGPVLLGRQLDFIRQILPSAKRIGVVSNPSLDAIPPFMKVLKEESEKRGFSVVEAPAFGPNEVVDAARSLVGKSDLIYVPQDNTVIPVLESVIRVGEQAKLPVFNVDGSGVSRGTLLSVAFNYSDVGREAARLVVDILKGAKVGQVKSVEMSKAYKRVEVIVNKTAAERIGLTIPPAILSQATKTY